MLPLLPILSTFKDPKVLIILGVAGGAGYLWWNYQSLEGDLAACETRWEEAQDATDDVIAEAQAQEYERRIALLETERETYARIAESERIQKEKEKAAKWQARRLLDEAREDPVAAEWLAKSWPPDLAEWLRAPTTTNSEGPDPDDEGFDTGDTDVVPDADT